MLDGHQRNTLDQIERHMHAEDPEFLARMQTLADQRPFPTISAICVSLFLSLPLVGLLFGPPTAFLIASAAALVIAGILIRRRVRAVSPTVTAAIRHCGGAAGASTQARRAPSRPDVEAQPDEAS